jgi:quinohemoprotein ethanol dehydrogenase
VFYESAWCRKECRKLVFGAAILILAASGCSRNRVTIVDDAALRAAADPGSWITYGHTYSEQRFSSLKQIDEQTVNQLGLSWYFDLETLRGLESTPLVNDGVLYATSAWSLVYAFDAKTGRVLWQYDPHVPKDHSKFVCCDVVNRGVALYRGRAYVGTLDGRLIALDAKTGNVVWDVQTTPKDGP